MAWYSGHVFNFAGFLLSHLEEVNFLFVLHYEVETTAIDTGSGNAVIDGPDS